MTLIRGKLYDGESADCHEVGIRVDTAGYLSSEGYQLPRHHFADVAVSPRVGNSPRYVDFPGGLRLETDDSDLLDDLLREWQPGQSGLAHRLEKNSRMILLSLFSLVLVVYLAVNFGIPALSRSITALLPTSLDDRLGGEVLEQLDGLIFQPSTLAATRQDQLRARFRSLLPDLERDFRIAFRSSELLGANAIALPDAQIIFTDQLIELAPDDEMLAAIMLHEIGHVAQRHAMRAVIGQAGLSMLVFVLTGDINSASSALVVMLPSFFIQSRYSRELEWEADSYALDEMLRRDLDPALFAAIMERMLDADPDETATVGETDRTTLLDYFQSHPPSRLRIQRFRQAAGDAPSP